MLVFGTQMHPVTFVFVSVELVFLFYLVIYELARPDDKSIRLNIILISLLLAYNITGGLLPDPKLPGSFFTQEVTAYATGFITPSYFPYYVYHAFGLKQLKFHAYKGVFLFLLLPYLLFVIIFATTGDIKVAQNLLILPVLYAVWVIMTLITAINKKYHDQLNSKGSKSEMVVLLFSIASWIGLPIIAYFNLGQVFEALITNLGFLLLFGLQVNRNIVQLRIEHERLIESEQRLKSWNANLVEEVDKRTKELEKANEQKTNNFINLVHETKTPLTLIKSYLDEYITKYGYAHELKIIKSGVDKLAADVTNLFDIERFTRGVEAYSHNQVSDFSAILTNNLSLFQYYCNKQKIKCQVSIEKDILIKADPNAINRIVNNIVENAIKFTHENGKIMVTLRKKQNNIIFMVKDTGEGIALDIQKKIFEPYFQIGHKNTRFQGMGLGLPIVKKVTDALEGIITIESNPGKIRGTTIVTTFPVYQFNNKDKINQPDTGFTKLNYVFNYDDIKDNDFNPGRRSILVVEDNKVMLNFLFKRLSISYNVFCAENGAAALRKLGEMTVIPDLILSDIMMEKMDGFAFAKILSDQDSYAHVPLIFLTAKSMHLDRIKGLKLGALDFISKPFSFEELSQKIETILNHILKQQKAILDTSIEGLKKLKSREIGYFVASERSRFVQNCQLFHLTAREIEVARLIIKGNTYKNIAKELNISDKTVTKHTQNIFEKTEVSNKVELINKLKN